MLNKKVLRFIAALMAIGVIVAAFIWLISSPAPDARLKEEQKIYSAVLRFWVFPKRISEIKENTRIEEFTISGYGDQNCMSEECIRYIATALPDLKQDTLIDFQENNKLSYPIQEHVSPNIGIPLAQSAYDPAIKRYISFSRVGFNPSLTQALVLIDDCRGNACINSTGEFMYSSGNFVLLQKIMGIWIVRDHFESWLAEKPSP